MGSVVTHRYHTKPAIPFEEALPRLFSNLEGRHVTLNCGDCYVMDSAKSAGIWLANHEGNLIFEVFGPNRGKVGAFFPWVESVLGVRVFDKDDRDWDVSRWPLSPASEAALKAGLESIMTEPLVYLGTFSQFKDDDWVEEVYNLVQADDSDGALDALFEGIGAMVDSESLPEVETLLSRLQLDLLNEDLLVGVLCSTNLIAHKLPSYPDVVARVKGALQQRMPHDRVERILQQISCSPYDPGANQRYAQLVYSEG